MSVGCECATIAAVKLTLRKGLLAAGGLGEKLLALGDGLAAETDTLLRVEDGTLPDEALDATGTTVDLVESDLVNDLGAMLSATTRLAGLPSVEIRDTMGVGILSQGLDLLDLLREELSEALLEGLDANVSASGYPRYSDRREAVLPGSWRSSSGRR